ncbi:MAG TPA: tripartite tricarboxylate transporter substrate-binding protein [Xanthobacteraceae bacterium]|jgi:tripartite-type tricarboxylate transporter receptor subunit TctC
MRDVMRHAIGLLLAALLVGLAAPAPAQDYPTRPIKLLVSYPPGGASDLIARMFGEQLSRRMGQPVVVENRPGAAGNMAGEVAAHAASDGYTLLLGPSALFAINPHLYAKMPIDPLKDLVPIASLVENELVLAADPKLTAGMDFKAFIEFARNAKPPLFYASIGNGSEHHLAMELLKRAAHVDLTHVPYRGGGPAALGVMAGNTAAMFGGGSVVPLIKSGQLHALAVTGAKRSTELPDLPTVAEFYPGYEVTLWQGLFAPVGTPNAIVAHLRRAAAAIRALPEFAKRLAAGGAGEPWILSDAEFTARIRADNEKYGRVIDQIGVKVQ